MIKSNLMPPQPKKVALSVLQKGKNKPAGKKKGGKFSYLLLIILIAATVYYNLYGIPAPLRKIISREKEIDDARPVHETEIAVPRLIAKGFSVKEPSVPVNASVEEAVKTLRPDIYIRDKNNTSTPAYNKELQAFGSRSCTKQAFYLMLNTFYEATPDGIGYLDLVYRAPHFYFARVMAVDSASRVSYINGLKSKGVNLTVIDSASYRNGNVEFSLQGNILLAEERKTELVQASKISSEILALRSLAAFNQVRLAGLENPIEENFGIYRRVVLKTITEADYPSILSFADAMQKSDISFNVQYFASRPLGSDRMQSALEFVMYATAK